MIMFMINPLQPIFAVLSRDVQDAHIMTRVSSIITSFSTFAIITPRIYSKFFFINNILPRGDIKCLPIKS